MKFAELALKTTESVIDRRKRYVLAAQRDKEFKYAAEHARDFDHAIRILTHIRMGLIKI